MKLLALPLLLLASFGAGACDITLSSGGNLRAAVSTYAGQTICLNTGSYALGSADLFVPANTTIEGHGADREAVVVNSSASRAFWLGSGVTLKGFTVNGTTPVLSGGTITGTIYGVITSDDNIVIWGMLIKNAVANIGIIGSTNVDILDTFVRYNGLPNDGAANPNIWITGATDVTLYYGAAYGRANGPGGDGEVAAYDSTDVHVEGTWLVDSGASALYFVNCDDCTVSDATVYNAGEWGLDIVDGSDNFVATNNAISNSRYAGSAFTQSDDPNGQYSGNIGGTYIGNTFYMNNYGNMPNACNGIAVRGNINALTLSGNTANPAGTICTFSP